MERVYFRAYRTKKNAFFEAKRWGNKIIPQNKIIRQNKMRRKHKITFILPNTYCLRCTLVSMCLRKQQQYYRHNLSMVALSRHCTRLAPRLASLVDLDCISTFVCTFVSVYDVLRLPIYLSTFTLESIYLSLPIAIPTVSVSVSILVSLFLLLSLSLCIYPLSLSTQHLDSRALWGYLLQSRRQPLLLSRYLCGSVGTQGQGRRPQARMGIGAVSTH